MTNKRNISLLLRYGIAILVITAAVVLVFLFAGKNKTVYTAPVPTVVVAKPVSKTIEVSITLSGHIEARSMIPVVPLVSGIITEYPVKSGQLVKKGDILAVIDEESFRQQMLQAKAAYTGYESSFLRVEGLYKAGAATHQEYDTVKAQRDAAKAQYDLAVLQLSYARVTAPVSGTVLSAPLAAGTVGSSQQPVAVIADLNDLVIRLDVPEKYFPIFTDNADMLDATVIRPAAGMGSSLGTADEICKAVVDTIAPYIDGASKSFKTEFRLIHAPDTFRPGMFVKVTVIFRRYEQVPALPVTALKTDGSSYLFNTSEESTASVPINGTELIYGTAEHSVLPFEISDGSWYMVPAEYADRLFIIEGQATVFDGQPVSASVVEFQEFTQNAAGGTQ